MIPGALLLKIARACCSARRCTQMFEPALADFQHDVQSSAGRVKLGQMVSGYAALWRTFIACAARDLIAPESVRFLARAAAAFVTVVGASCALEWILVNVDPMLRNDRSLLFRIPYVGWYARLHSAALIFVVPVAVLPALWFAARRASTAGVSRIAAAGMGLIATLAASGWIAPAIERAKTLRMREEFVAQTQGRFYMQPLDVALGSTAKSLPDLIRSALAPPPHRFPGYPNYVAPEDQFGHDACWRDLKFRALLLFLSALAGTVAAYQAAELKTEN